MRSSIVKRLKKSASFCVAKLIVLSFALNTNAATDDLATKDKFDGIFLQMVKTMESNQKPSVKLKNFNQLYWNYLKETDRYTYESYFDKSVLDSNDLKYAWILNRKIIPLDGLAVEISDNDEKFTDKSCLQRASLATSDFAAIPIGMNLPSVNVYEVLKKICPNLKNL